MSNNILSDLYRKTYTPRYQPYNVERNLNTNVWKRGGLLTKNYSTGVNRYLINYFVKDTVARGSTLFLFVTIGINKKKIKLKGVLIYKKYKNHIELEKIWGGRDPHYSESKNTSYPELHYFSSLHRNRALGNVFDVLDLEWKKPDN